jgi:hypothetical protein
MPLQVKTSRKVQEALHAGVVDGVTMARPDGTEIALYALICKKWL